MVIRENLENLMTSGGSPCRPICMQSASTVCGDDQPVDFRWRVSIVGMLGYYYTGLLVLTSLGSKLKT